MKPIINLVLVALLAYSCGVNANKETNVDPSNSSDIPGEILIDLKEGVIPSDFSLSLKKYELKENAVVSPSLNIVLFDFNDQKIALHKLIEEVKKMDNVENAQSNKKINSRN